MKSPQVLLIIKDMPPYQLLVVFHLLELFSVYLTYTHIHSYGKYIYYLGWMKKSYVNTPFFSFSIALAK